jgi:hypothetical protein
MRVLVGCEKFGRVRAAFRALGHDAWSCDLLPALDGSPFHLRCDVRTVLDRDWDIAIFFPDCTYLTTTAAWAFGDGPYHQPIKPGTLVGAARREARAQAIMFVFELRDAPIPCIAIENPKGFLSRAWRPPDQTIQPHHFGDDASKATCLWLKNLPRLRPTAWAEPRIDNLPLFGGTAKRPRWSNQSDAGQNNHPDRAGRAMERGATFPGIAKAFAQQWGSPWRMAA